MKNFNHYYCEYLGIFDHELHEKDVCISESPFRELPINKHHYFPVIITHFNKKMICSCVPELKSLLKGLALTHIKSKVKSIYPFVQWQTYIRFSKENNDQVLTNSAQVLNPVEYCKINELDSLDKINPDLMKLLSEQRCFVILQNNKIVSNAIISDVFAGGANIVVSTHPEYRGKGYAKEVVKEALNYCRINHLLPIYFAREDNIPSLKVAQACGFKLQSREESAYFNYMEKR
jgi:predicted GNAT family acetyltransferase